MENINLIKQFKTIGKINAAISKAETMDDAIKNGLKEILNGLKIEYAVIWYQDKKGDQNLHPYFWIAPIDLTNKYHVANQEIVGKVFSSQKTTCILDFQNNRDITTENDFYPIKINSMICVPLIDEQESIGCVQFINSTNRDKISADESEVCEILCLLASSSISEKSRDLDFSWRNKKPIMQIRDICKEFKNGDVLTKVLNGVNLDVYQGEFLVILGESGCGKSTFLNILAGLDYPTSGNCYFNDEDISHFSQDQLTQYRRDNIGFIFQSYNLMSNLTAKQNLDLIGELVKHPLDSKETLKMVGLEDKIKHYPFQLSGGQQQRISIARALVKNPKIIFADEPTAALDYATSIEILEVLSNIKENGTTLVMVTHNEEISKMANRVVRMRGGKIYEVTINKHPLLANELVW